jgi:hypothetical protein
MASVSVPIATEAGELGRLKTTGTPSLTARIMSTSVYGISATGLARSRFSTSRVFRSSLGKM